jgi:hypothetical protein
MTEESRMQMVPLFPSDDEMRAAHPEPMVDGPPFAVVCDERSWKTWRNVGGRWSQFMYSSYRTSNPPPRKENS